MSRPNIRNIKKLPDFSTTYNWNIRLINAPKGVATPPSDDLNFRAISTTIPKATIQPMDINIRGYSIQRHGTILYDKTWMITFAETVDNKITDWITAWHEACWATGSGVQQGSSQVIADLEIHRLNRQDETIFTQRLIGCWLTEYDPTGGELGDATPEIIKPQLTIAYDYFKRTL